MAVGALVKPADDEPENLVVQDLEHNLGLANFRLHEPLKEAANVAGLRIQQSRFWENRFHVMHQGVDADVSKLCPSHISHDDGVFTVGALKRFLTFVRQPTKAAVNYHFGHSESSERKAAHEKLVLVNQVMNWLGSDDGFVGDYAEYEAGPGGLNSCHEAAEELYEQQDSWREQMAFGARELVHEEHPEAAISNSGVDPDHGYYIDLNPDVLGGAAPVGSYQASLQQEVKSLLRDALGEGALENGRLYFTADQLVSFCGGVCKSEMISELVEQVVFEEKSQFMSERVENGKAELAASQSFERLSQSGKSSEQQLKLLAGLSSALTPLVDPKMGDPLFAEFHVAHKYMSPFSQISEDYKQLEHQIERRLNGGAISPEDVQKILLENLSLVSFSKALSQEMGHAHISKAFDVLGFAKVGVDERFMEGHHQQGLEVIRRAKGTGGSPVGHMFKAAGTSIMAVIEDTIEEGFQSKKRSYVSAGLVVAYVSLQAALINPTVQQTVSDLVYGPKDETVSSALFFNPDGTTEIGTVANDVAGGDVASGHINAEDVITRLEQLEPGSTLKTEPELCRVTHYHVVGASVVPQCYFGDKLKDASLGVVDKVDYSADFAFMAAGVIDEPQASGSHVTNRARQVVDPTLNVAFYFNMAQFAAHILFFAAMFGRGSRQGPRAYKTAASLIGEFTDSTYHMAKYRPLLLPAIGGAVAYGVTNSWDLSSIVLSSLAAGAAGNHIAQFQPKMFKQLMDVAAGVNMTPEAHDAFKNLQAMAVAQGHAAQIRNGLPEHVRDAHVNLDVGGFPAHLKIGSKDFEVGRLPEDFTIGAHNLSETLDALAAFDVLLNHAGENIGVSDPWERRLLGNKLEKVTAAFEDFARDGDAAALQSTLNAHLVDVMGAEKRHVGDAGIYQALQGGAAWAESERLLKRHGNYEHRRVAHGAIIRDRSSRSTLDRGLAIDDRVVNQAIVSSVSAWSDAVEGYRSVQGMYTRIPGGYKKAFGRAAVGYGAVAAGLDITGHTEKFSSAVVSGLDDVGVSFGVSSEVAAEKLTYALDQSSGVIGDVSGIGLSSLIFGGYNIYDDIFLNDAAGGLTALTAGVVGGYVVYRHVGKPVYEIYKEQRRGVEPPAALSM